MKINSLNIHYFHKFFAINIIIFSFLSFIKYSNENIAEVDNKFINNSIIKTQFPNDIIIIGEESQRYLNFVTFSNGDMLFQTSAYPCNNKRKFYGLKSNGRGYFKIEGSNKETPFYSLYSIQIKKYESGNSIFVKDGKEYFLSMGRLESQTEIIDFDNKTIISNQTKSLLNFENKNRKTNIIKIDKNVYILSGIYSDSYNPYIIKFSLNFENGNKLTSSINNTDKKLYNGIGQIGSCFLTEKSGKIICFYGVISNNFNYSIIAYSQNLEQLIEDSYNFEGIKKDNYYYSIFFREDAGVFIYYNSITKYPVIYFKKYEENIQNF